MPRVHHVKKARKPIERAGVQPGDSYYWWRFRDGVKRVSRTYPKPSQLTQSPFLQQYYTVQERIAEDLGNASDEHEASSLLDDLAGELRELAEQCEESLNEMPEPLQEGPTGELLDERRQLCEEFADALEGIDAEDFLGDGAEGTVASLVDEVQSCDPDIS